MRLGLVTLASSLVLTTAMASAADPSLFRSKEKQSMTVVSDGSLSLQKRLEMIKSAKKNIEAEFFIYNLDESGRIFTQALIRKAQEGVKVRLLIDYGLPVAELDTFFTSVLINAGITKSGNKNLEIRYYNPALAFELLRGQYRSHRKSLTVDDRIAVTGGRNIADEYFDLNPKYDFLDRDVFVEGSMAGAIRASFDEFWKSKMTKNPEMRTLPTRADFGLGDPAFHDAQAEARYNSAVREYQEKTAEATSYITENENDRQVLQGLIRLEAISAPKVHARDCYDSIFAADNPGIGSVYRVLYSEIQQQLLDARTSIDAESPYFIMKTDGNDLLSGILAKGVGVSLYTNSLNSTDAFYTTADFYPRIGELIHKGMNVYIFKGQSLPNHQYINSQVQGTRWGIHAKSAVIDGKDIMVGTFNADPRSHNINTEMAIMCRGNAELAQDVLASMKETQAGSVQLNEKGDPVDGESKFFNVSFPKLAEYFLLSPAANLFDFLL